jgi:hypothetical protein
MWKGVGMAREINHEKGIIQERGVDRKKGECREKFLKKKVKLNMKMRSAHAEETKKVKSCKKEELRTTGKIL